MGLVERSVECSCRLVELYHDTDGEAECYRASVGCVEMMARALH